MHIASQAGHPDTALVFLKKGVPLHMPNKVRKFVRICEEVDLQTDSIGCKSEHRRAIGLRTFHKHILFSNLDSLCI